MSYDDYAASAESGQPVELYLFTYGKDSQGDPLYFAYTDATAPITHDGIVYNPLPIERSNIESEGTLESPEVTVTVPRTSDVADLFRVYPPAQVVSVKIRQGNVANPDDPSSWDLGENFPVAWLGRVLECSRDDDLEAKLSCEAASASMKRSGLRRHYQWPCPLVLYGPRCQADKTAATKTVTADSVGGNTITPPASWFDPNAAGDYVGGLVEWDTPTGTQLRSILDVQGDTIQLTGPTTGLSAGDSVKVILGCPHTLSGCESVHNNVVNYGGQPFIPTHNPIGKNNHY